MNIQIDTNLKTIKLAETVNLKELSEVLDKLFPKKEWMEYKLETNTVINNWTTPIVYRNWYPYQWQRPYITYGDSTRGDLNETFTTNNSSGIYNLSIN